ncbi:MAG: ABC transporter ATP-binding protein [Bryobacterales bacterium]|nr:ABC transporter ATP-binding protein [Bryobacterales bacterium]
MNAQAVIQAEGLTRHFGAVTAVNGLNLQVQRGEIFGLVGPDGAGKTTTVRLLCGLLDADGGRAAVAGYDVASNLDAMRDRIGYMAQRFGLYTDLTVEENMAFYADLFGVTGSERARLMERLLRMTRMEPFRSRAAGKLSGGMKQKLSLMCALLHRPEVLFLDEPTNGVDPVSRRDFWTILYQLAQDGMTVFITTAYLDEAERCNRVGLMSGGRLIRCESPRALREAIKETCWEVGGSRLRELRRFLRNLPGVESAEPAGATLHVFTTPGETGRKLESAVRQAGFEDAAFRAITPSLEDVFVALVEANTSGETAHGSQ